MTHEMPVLFQVVSLIAVVGLLMADLAVIGRRPHVPSTRESLRWVAVYVVLALVFAALVGVVGGAVPAGEFIAGWLTEYSLSVDNLFVFVLIMSAFAVPRDHQQKVLLVGIIIALVLRGGFILAGAAVVTRYSWVFYVFGAFLVYTAVHLLRGGESGDDEYHENVLVRAARRFWPISREYDGGAVRTVVDGRRMFTPLLVVFLAIGTTDVLFAFDSIPAIFGLTHDPFIVFTSNVFALMGLRQLFFLLGGVLDRIVYLPYGLAAILGFIGLKLVSEALRSNTVPFVNGGRAVGWAPEVPTWVSLVVIAGSLGAATAASVVHANRHRLPGRLGRPIGDRADGPAADETGALER
ncbi:MAG: tellurium resistance protein TerC [Cellulomonas sp. 73-145]|uniref:TerC family protein n=1 Tax=Cellulomonas sp. 73-145 TaxID=1895739 RepID=UPI000926E633|nr:TerC family protein [Cellulomonas sp. 73-145]MBN9327302.1 TerC family protein [Cellulomonas sp.]OJV60950.1 MAG: tellurium resistance protein TerC [Cellulomonas sp. 73-145]